MNNLKNKGVAISATATKILDENWNRLGALIVNWSAKAVRIGDANVTQSFGIPLSANGGSLTISKEDFYTTSAVYAASSGVVTLDIMEV